MGVTRMKFWGDVHAVILGLLGAGIVALTCPTPIDRDTAIEEAAAYLDETPATASLSIRGDTWTVAAGDEEVTLDAQTGELIEVSF